MTDTPKVIEVDCSTGESIERDMTAEEIANMEAMRAEQEARQAEAEAKARGCSCKGRATCQTRHYRG